MPTLTKSCRKNNYQFQIINFILRFSEWDFSYRLCFQFSCDAEKLEKTFVLRKMDAFLTVTFHVDFNLVWCLKNTLCSSSARELNGDDADGKQAVIWFWFRNVRLFLMLDAVTFASWWVYRMLVSCVDTTSLMGHFQLWIAVPWVKKCLEEKNVDIY